MIRNDFTNETAHFANWLLCGTRIDLVEWLDDAIEAERGVSIPEEFAGENPQGISVDDAEEIIDRLGWDLQTHLLPELIYGAMPNACSERVENPAMIGLSEDDYRAFTLGDLMVTLLSTAIERIDFNGVARIIAEHIWGARVATRANSGEFRQHELN